MSGLWLVGLSLDPTIQLTEELWVHLGPLLSKPSSHYKQPVWWFHTPVPTPAEHLLNRIDRFDQASGILHLMERLWHARQAPLTELPGEENSCPRAAAGSPLPSSLHHLSPPPHLIWPLLDFPEAGTLLAPGKVGIWRGGKGPLCSIFILGRAFSTPVWIHGGTGSNRGAETKMQREVQNLYLSLKKRWVELTNGWCTGWIVSPQTTFKSKPLYLGVWSYLE